MQKFQDSVTGQEWHFDAGIDITTLPNVPKTLSPIIIPRPDSSHEWVKGAWQLNPAIANAALMAAAKAALDKLTAPAGTVMRCYMAGIAFPADWQAYRAALLAIANGTDSSSTVLPTQPAYPAGT